MFYSVAILSRAMTEAFNIYPHSKILINFDNMKKNPNFYFISTVTPRDSMVIKTNIETVIMHFKFLRGIGDIGKL